MIGVCSVTLCGAWGDIRVIRPSRAATVMSVSIGKVI
jgi:hypothetical protein